MIWRDIAVDLGHLVSEHDLNRVGLVEMLTLREQYPVTFKTATTNRERCIVVTLDGSIMGALLALGVVSDEHEDYGHYLYISHDERLKPMRNALATGARHFLDAAKMLIDIPESDWNQDKNTQDAVLAQAMDGNAFELYKGVFSGDSEFLEECDWWTVIGIGYSSFDEWLTRNPWWERDGYKSYEQAMAEIAAGEADYN